MSKTKKDRLRQQTAESPKLSLFGGVLGKCRNAGVCLLAAVTLLAGCSSEEGAVSSSPTGDTVPEATGASYETCVAEIGDSSKTISISGSLVYPQRQDLYFDGQGARVDTILVENGQEVKEGDVLATFTVESSEADLKEKRLSVEQAQRSFNQGVEDREEEIELQKKIAASGDKKETLKLEELQSSLALFKLQNQANIDQLEEELAEMENAAGKTTLTAPFDGVVDSINGELRKGTSVNSGTQIMAVYSQSPVYIAVEDSSHSLRLGMKVTVTAGRNNDRRQYTGLVVAAPEALPASMGANTYYIEAKDAPLDILEITPTVSAEIALAEDVVVVSRKAVTTEDGKSYVRILEDGAIHKRYVVIGWDDLKTSVWIAKGVEPGQTLILG